jgi:hypothetical protein
LLLLYNLLVDVAKTSRMVFHTGQISTDKNVEKVPLEMPMIVPHD